MTEEPISAKAAAREFGSDARTLRKFLRSDQSPFEAVGQGRRYEFNRKQMDKLGKQFKAWLEEKKAKAIEVEEEDLDDSIEELEIEDE